MGLGAVQDAWRKDNSPKPPVDEPASYAQFLLKLLQLQTV